MLLRRLTKEEGKIMAIKIPSINEESLLIFQAEVQEHDNLVVSDMFAQSLINRIRELELALNSAKKI
jgi:hypothetical protein